MTSGKYETARSIALDECKVDGCDDVVKASGYCNMHYNRVVKTGTPGAADPVFSWRGGLDEPRACTSCSEIKPAEHFLVDPRHPSKRLSHCRRCRGIKSKRNLILRRYGITIDEYDAMLESQGGGCAVCGSTGRLCVDHEHESGRVRGILCDACNVALGRLGDDPDRIRRLADYVQ